MTKLASSSSETKASFGDVAYKHAVDFALEQKPIYYNGVFYVYTGTHYRPVAEPSPMINKRLQRQRCMITTMLLSNIVMHLKGLAYLDAHDYGEVPFWKKNQHVADASCLIPFQNGLLDIDAFLSGHVKLKPLTPDLVSFYCLPFDFAKAPCPLFQRFLGQVFKGSEDQIDLLQEWFGYCMAADVSEQKFMIMIGPPRAGKGTLAKVQEAVLGSENVIGYSLDRLVDRFGIAPLRTKQLAIIPEVELSNHRERKQIVEKLKSVIGNDDVPIERKGVNVTESCVLPTRWLISSNQMPHLPDPSGALAERMLSLKFRYSFAGKEDTGLLAKLKTELGGIAYWSLQGLKRLRKDGWTKSVESMKQTNEFRRDSSKPLAFLQDRCVVWAAFGNDALLPNVERCTELPVVNTYDLAQAYVTWAGNKGSAEPGDFNWFMRDVKSLLVDLKTSDHTRSGVRVYEVIGLKLKSND